MTDSQSFVICPVTALMAEFRYQHFSSRAMEKKKKIGKKFTVSNCLRKEKRMRKKGDSMTDGRANTVKVTISADGEMNSVIHFKIWSLMAD